MRNVLLYCVIVKLVECKSPLRGIGGRDAEPGEYPYVVSIELHDKKENRIRKQLKCTGSVLTPTWTLSAAHCFEYDINIGNISLPVKSWISLQHEDLAFVISNELLNSTLPNEKRHRRIDKVISHQAYRMVTLKQFNDVTIYNDLALAHHEPFYVNQFAKVASLDYISLIGHEVVLAGYGDTHDSRGNLLSALELFKPFQVLNTVVIKCPTRSNRIYPSLCVAQRCKKENTRACPGDSGGPVIHSAGIVGVMTASYICLQKLYIDIPRTAGFITPLSPYIQWIADHTRHP